MKTYKLLTTFFLTMTFNLHAAEFCANTGAGIQAALTIAQSNNQHNVIKIVEGSYTTPGSEFSYSEGAGWDLTISGGWTEFFGNTCGQQLSGDPWNTVLDGDSTTRIMNIRSGGNSEITISNLTFINGGNAALSAGGGLRFWHASGFTHTGQVNIERSIFINNQAEKASAITFYSSGERSYFRNNIFTLNESTNGNNTIEINQDSGSGIYFTNNTVFDNSGDASNNFGGLQVYTATGSETLIVNNILYNNGNRDLHLSFSGDVYLKTNNIGNLFGTTPIESTGNISAPPHFVPGLFSYTPASYSQLLNAGTKPCSTCPLPIPFDEFWILGTVDILGDIRVQHGRVDIGAIESPHESELIFVNGFE
ncbi:MAG: hypothetical protein ACSHWU_06760 [Marinicella sp.]